MNLQIYNYKFLIFSIAFISFTAIGTLSHEYGHIVVAENLGYETTLHYGSMNWNKINLNSQQNGSPVQKKSLKTDELFISLGGPIQTILTGLIGLTILLIRRKRIIKIGLETLDWIAVFLSLFWLREVFNLVMSIANGVIKQNGKYFSGDEFRISYLLGLPSGTMSIILGSLGIFVSLYIVFQVIPKH